MKFEKHTPKGGRLITENEGKYLWIPVCRSDKKEELTCEYEDGTLLRFIVPVLEDKADILYYGAICADGGRISVSGDFPEAFFDAVRTDDRLPDAVGLRPAIHFAARNGWINDPNGLILHDGIYHMYFQFNPVDTVWGNMSWGHAVSRDLLHWQQLDDVMYPDEDGTIFSGSAISNGNACLSLPENALLFYYTGAGSTNSLSEGKPFTQKIAYSLDGGNTFVKIKEPAVKHLLGENRDPKIYYYEPRGIYYMALYLDGDEFAILNSNDMQNFTVTQHIYMEGSGECPDLRQIPADDGSEQWLFMQADGRYYTGGFDGIRFEIRSEAKCAYKTKLPYAAQTMNKPDDRVILIPWLRMSGDGCAYTGMMGVPRELSLAVQNGEHILRLKPVKEYFDARRRTDKTYYSFADGHALELEIHMGKAEAAFARIGGIELKYDKKSGVLKLDKEEIPFERELLELHIIIDKGILEISSHDYLYFAAVEVSERLLEGEVSVTSAAPASDFEYVIYEI